MGRLGQLLIGAVGAGLVMQAAALAAPRASPGNWVGTWGYVALTPPPGAAGPALAPPAPPPGPTPLGVFTPPAAPPLRYGLGPSALALITK